MSAAAMLILFGIGCPKPCPISRPERAALEQEIIRALSARGYAIRPPPPGADRPTGPSASLEPRDEAARLNVARVLSLELEAGGRKLWLTHFIRGTVGVWSVDTVLCQKGPGGAAECPGLTQAVVQSLRPRKATDVDFIGALRGRARHVETCVFEEDQVPAHERIFGRVEMELEAKPTGRVKMKAIAPARVAKAPLGRCLVKAMESMNVGPFEGEPIRLRIPLDL